MTRRILLTALCILSISLACTGEADAARAGKKSKKKQPVQQSSLIYTLPDHQPTAVALSFYDRTIWVNSLGTYGSSIPYIPPLRTEIELSSSGKGSSAPTGSDTWRYALRNADVGATASLYGKTRDMRLLFLNAYHDFKTDGAVKPYVGGGFGLAIINGENRADAAHGELAPIGGYGVGEDKSGSQYEAGLAWNAGLGLGWEANPRLNLDLGYRVSGMADNATQLGESNYSEYNSESDRLHASPVHQLRLGLRLAF